MEHDGAFARAIEQALREDIGLGDLTGDAVLPGDAPGRGEFLCKAPGVVAGLDVAEAVFRTLDDRIGFERLAEEGADTEPGRVLGAVTGPARVLLRGERTALNFLQRMSGIATMTRTFVRAVEGTRARITDTRKTAPGLRPFDKLAVRRGGGVNHRFGLDDMVLIKDNHIVAAGGITPAVERCRAHLAALRIAVPVEVETKNLAEVEEALRCEGVDRIMFDNFSPVTMHEAVRLVGGRTETEASGGITLHSVRSYAETGVDFISVGALTHSVAALDISLELLHLHA
jgi:nicotinate-nucleotide pyrophosphorylase (carboxylating)